MLRFYGYQLEFVVEAVIERRDGNPVVFAASDEAGHHWLVVATNTDGMDQRWVCAPATRRVLDLVTAGQAAAADVLRHSRTGWVEELRMVSGHPVADRRVACADLGSRSMTGHPAGARAISTGSSQADPR